MKKVSLVTRLLGKSSRKKSPTPLLSAPKTGLATTPDTGRWPLERFTAGIDGLRPTDALARPTGRAAERDC